MEAYTIGKLASAADVNVETIRYYERRGLVRRPPRTGSGYRQYDALDLERLRFVARAKDLGFTLSEIGELLSSDTDSTPTAVLDAARAKLASVRRRERELATLRTRLERLIGTCEGGLTDDCASLQLSS